MLKGEYIVNKRDFTKKKRSVLKTKIIKLLKAYTLRDFLVDDKKNTVTCKISVKRDGVVMEFPKMFMIVFQLKEIIDNEDELRLCLYASMS